MAPRLGHGCGANTGLGKIFWRFHPGLRSRGSLQSGLSRGGLSALKTRRDVGRGDRSAAFTPLQLARVSTRKNILTFSFFRTLKRPEGRAPRKGAGAWFLFHADREVITRGKMKPVDWEEDWEGFRRPFRTELRRAGYPARCAGLISGVPSGQGGRRTSFSFQTGSEACGKNSPGIFLAELFEVVFRSILDH